MRLRQIDAFRTIMATGNATRAAEKLRISQPAISRLLADLEEHLGLRLFERRAGRLIPTREGEAFREYVDRSFLGLEALERAARDIARLGGSQIRLAAFPAISLRWMPSIVAELASRYPDLKVNLQITDSQRVCDLVATHHADVGLTTINEDPPGVQVVHRLKLDCVCVVPQGHRLAKRARINVADLASERFIALSPEFITSQTLRSHCSAQGVQLQTAVECSSANVACELVRQGLGIAVIDPLTAVANAPEGVVFRRLSPKIAFQFALVRPDFGAMSLAVETLAELVILSAEGVRAELNQRLR